MIRESKILVKNRDQKSFLKYFLNLNNIIVIIKSKENKNESYT